MRYAHASTIKSLVMKRTDCAAVAASLPDSGVISTFNRKVMTQEKTYILFMPQEERFFFQYFHGIALVLLLAVVCLRILVSKSTPGDAMIFAMVLVAPMYVMRSLFGKRFAESVTIDFHTRKVRFAFNDERGTIEKDFQEIKKIYFRFYLTFVMDDIRVMIKRPSNKKAVFQLLQNISHVDVGMFKGF